MPSVKTERQIPVADAAEKLGVEQEFVIHCIQAHWIIPIASEEMLLDEEDLARARLILELRETFGVNDDSIPVILHLLDQLYYLRRRIERIGRAA